MASARRIGVSCSACASCSSIHSRISRLGLTPCAAAYALSRLCRPSGIRSEVTTGMSSSGGTSSDWGNWASSSSSDSPVSTNVSPPAAASTSSASPGNRASGSTCVTVGLPLLKLGHLGGGHVAAQHDPPVVGLGVASQDHHEVPAGVGASPDAGDGQPFGGDGRAWPAGAGQQCLHDFVRLDAVFGEPFQGASRPLVDHMCDCTTDALHRRSPPAKPYTRRMARMVVDPRFRAVLANLIMSAGIRQAELARRACLSPSHLSQILNGDRNPSDQMARALDAALGADGQLADLVLLAAN